MIGGFRLPALTLVAALALGACTAGPRPPLYVPMETAGSYGFFHEELGQNRLRVGYRAPIARAYELSRAERQREGERLVTLSYDLALLRAAELAAARNAPSFDVDDRQNDVDATVRTDYGPDPFYPPWPYWHHRYRPYPFYGPGLYVERSTEVAAGVTFVATLREGAAGAFDTGETLSRLRARLPPADRPAGAPTGSGT